MAPKTASTDDASSADGESKPLSRHERRHGARAKPVPEPTIQIPKVWSTDPICIWEEEVVVVPL